MRTILPIYDIVTYNLGCMVDKKIWTEILGFREMGCYGGNVIEVGKNCFTIAPQLLMKVIENRNKSQSTPFNLQRTRSDTKWLKIHPKINTGLYYIVNFPK